MDIECLVVGGGPAGLAAAAESAKWGAETLLVEQHPPGEHTVGSYSGEGGDQDNNGMKLALLAQDVSFAGAAKIHGALVWAAFPDGSFGVTTPAQSLEVFPWATILAMGAYERLLPFAGWDLPYVMTPSEALTFSRRRRGLGPFRWVVAGIAGQGIEVAVALRASGTEVVAVAEGDAQFSDPSSDTRDLKVLFGYTIKQVLGNEAVNGVEVTSINDRESSLRFEADGVCLAWGSIPAIDLARLAGCQMEFHAELGGHIPKYDDNMHTSVEGTFVAGNVAGLCSTKTAIVEGRLAGLMAAHHVGKANGTSYHVRREQLKAEFQKTREEDSSWVRTGVASAAMLEEYHVRLALKRQDVLLCRCEQVRAWGADIRKAIVEGGALTPGDLKRFTRAGMGECQGRMCRPLLARAIAILRHKEVAEVQSTSYRPPVQPVPVAHLVSDRIT